MAVTPPPYPAPREQSLGRPGHAIYCASRGKALLDKILLNTRNWDLPAARHVLFCGVSTRTVEKFWRLLEVLAAKHFRIESLPLDEAR